MNNVNPTDLTEEQWLLLRHLHQYNTPFYTEFLYAQFSEHKIHRLEFYRMFFVLAALSYIRMDGYGDLVPGHKQDFSYVVTPKGKRAIAEYMKKVKPESITRPVAKCRTKGIIAAYLAKTTVLKDYVFNH